MPKRKALPVTEPVKRSSLLPPDQALACEIQQLQAQIARLKGPHHLLEYRRLVGQLKQCQHQLDQWQQKQQVIQQVDQVLHQLQPDTQPTTHPRKNRITVQASLFPTKAGTQNMLDTMSLPRRKKLLQKQTFERRKALLEGHLPSLSTRYNEIDECRHCGVSKVVNKEEARAICPRCGETKVFASHVFEMKESDKDEHPTATKSDHIQNFGAQFERGYPHATPQVLDLMTQEYRRIHLHDPHKVNVSQTQTFMKQQPELPKLFRRAPERLSRELSGESIPEFSNQEWSLILEQRNRMQQPDRKKSRGCKNYVRQLGRANGFEIARLFKPAKTINTHVRQSRELEDECERLVDTDVSHKFSWIPYPIC